MPGYPLTADDIHRAEAALGDDPDENTEPATEQG
jgi:hypothetical protein